MKPIDPNFDDTLASSDSNPTSVLPSATCFWVIAKGQQNQPDFKTDECLCIDPQHDIAGIAHGKMVVISHNKELSFRVVDRSKGLCQLKFLNPEFAGDTIEFDESCILIGKYIGSFIPPRTFPMHQHIYTTKQPSKIQ